MKLLAIILSIYVSILSCMVCNDGIDAKSDSNTTSISMDNSLQHPEQADTCSPFCICSCCAGFVSLVFSAEAIHLKYTELKSLSQYLVLAPKGASLTIFQPPRLV